MNKIWILCVLAFASCSEAFKMQKAEDRVTASRPALERVGRKFLELHPCANDSAIKYIPGAPIVKTDTITFTDTFWNTDTIVKTVTKTVTRQIKTTDTIEVAVRDRQYEKILQKDLDEANAKVAAREILLAEEIVETGKQTAKKNKYFWILIISNIAWAGWTFRKPLMALFGKL